MAPPELTEVCIMYLTCVFAFRYEESFVKRCKKEISDSTCTSCKTWRSWL